MSGFRLSNYTNSVYWTKLNPRNCKHYVGHTVAAFDFHLKEYLEQKEMKESNLYQLVKDSKMDPKLVDSMEPFENNWQEQLVQMWTREEELAMKKNVEETLVKFYEMNKDVSEKGSFQKMEEQLSKVFTSEEMNQMKKNAKEGFQPEKREFEKMFLAEKYQIYLERLEIFDRKFTLLYPTRYMTKEEQESFFAMKKLFEA